MECRRGRGLHGLPYATVTANRFAGELPGLRTETEEAVRDLVFDQGSAAIDAGTSATLYGWLGAKLAKGTT